MNKKNYHENGLIEISNGKTRVIGDGLNRLVKEREVSSGLLEMYEVQDAQPVDLDLTLSEQEIEYVEMMERLVRESA